MSEQLRFQSLQSSVPVTVGSEAHMGGFVGGLLGAICAKRGSAPKVAVIRMKKNRVIFQLAGMMKFILAFLVPFPGTRGARLDFCLSEQLGMNTRQKVGGLFLRPNMVRINTALLFGWKDGLFEMGSHFDVSGKMVVDVGVQVSGVDVCGAKIGDGLVRRIGQFEADGIRARRSQRQIGFERVGATVAAGQGCAGDVFEKELACGGDDGTVIVKRAVDRASRNVRRNQDGGDAHAEAREIKRGIEGVGAAGPVFVVWIDSNRWRNVVVETAVLVIDDNEERRFAERLIVPDGVEGIADEDFALFDVVVGMLIAGGEESVVDGIFAVGITRLDQAVRGQAILFAVR